MINMSTGEASKAYIDTRPQYVGRTEGGAFLVAQVGRHHVVSGQGRCATCQIRGCEHAEAVERWLRSV